MTSLQHSPALGPLPEWRLDDLFPGPDSAEFRAALADAERLATEFAGRWRGRLAEAAAAADGGDRLAAAVAEYEALAERLGRIGSFATLHYVGDTTDPARQKFYGDTSQALTQISTGLVFFELEFNRLDDDLVAACLAASPGLARYRPWIEDLRKEKPYQLEDRIEQLFIEKSMTGAAAFGRLFDETMAAASFEVDGETLALEPTLNLLVDPDRARRQAAAEALAATFRRNLPLFTLITNTLAKDKEISDRWRGFADIAHSRHLANRVEPEVVAALTEAVRAAYPRLTHRYYAMKAGWLGLDRLMHWDRNAPLPQDDPRRVPWAEARDLVLRAYGGFAPQMAAIAGRFFAEGWIDAPIRPGKQPGAFAHPTVPSVHPYVLLNYQGKVRDVMTLAHELGHGVHQVLAAGQGQLLSQTPLTLAETASVFGEMLTFRTLLAETAEPARRKVLLAAKVEDMLNTVVRQIAFYTFERDVHARRRAGELTGRDIGDIWLAIQRESLGPAIELGDGYETFWTYIPHFIHTPFYVYAYAFGDCLVNSLYARYREAEAGFAEQYLEMLKAGGSKHHSELLAPFGLDATDPAFWDKGLSMIEGLIDELEALDRATA